MRLRIFFVFLFVVAFFLGLGNRIIYAQSADQLRSELAKIQADGKYIGATLFDAFKTNTDPSFSSYEMTDADIAAACGGPCGKIGINSATFYSQSDAFYQRAQNLGMKFTIEIANTEIDRVKAGLSAANSHGETPIIRIGVFGDSTGFTDAATYVAFLKNINATLGFDVYALAGPNEPETEVWATTKDCPDIKDYVCMGKILAKYMNDVINGAGNLSHIKLLSPAFNMTDTASVQLVQAMVANGANFNGVVGIAGNSYNIQGVPITKWVDDFMANTGLAGHKIFLTEVGNYGSRVPGTAPKPFDFTNEVPCDAVSNPAPLIPRPGYLNDPEYHSLRPYPANPCDKKIEDTTLLCANDLVVVKIPQEAFPGGTCTNSAGGSITCTYTEVPQSSKVSINLANAELPILGNTEDVPNATWSGPNTTAPNLTAAQRMNNYVSWYLNGVVNKAEADFLSFNENDLVNYSGPLNKLLPWAGQEVSRIASVTNAIKTPSQPANNKIDRHNQIVGCDFDAEALPCYLKDYSTNILNQILKIVFTQTFRLKDWPETKQPPLESKYAADNKTFQEYWKDYLIWLGKICSPTTNVLGIPVYFCSNLQQFYPTLFANVPFSTTEDRVGQIGTDNNTFSATDPTLHLAYTQQQDSKVSEVNFVPDAFVLNGPNSSQHALYFAHTQEDAELAKQLQGTFQSQDFITNPDLSKLDFDPKKNDDSTAFYNVSKYKNCEIQNAKTNPGDNLHGDIDRANAAGVVDQTISGTLGFKATYTCTFEPIRNIVSQLVTGYHEGKCETVYASMAIFTRTPAIQENWDRLVNGAASIFKRIFPKVGDNSPLKEIKEIPGVTTASYTSGSGDTVLAGNYNSQRSGSDAQVFIPYVGGIQEYFLTGIQTALRPQGFSSGTLEGAPAPSTNGNSGVAGSCRPEDMLIFGAGATAASCIANAESSCHPDSVNMSCLCGSTDGGKTGDCSSGKYSLDYSVGLFQYNLASSLNRCPGAFLNTGQYDENYHMTSPCVVKDQAVLDACVQKLSDPEYNKLIALGLSNGGKDWSPWSTHKSCGL